MTFTPAETTSSSWEDFLEIFYSPSRVLSRRQTQWGIPLLVLVVLSAAVILGTLGLLQPVLDAEASRAMATLTPEQRAQAQQMSSKFAWMFPASMIVLTAVAPLILGFILWLVGKMFGANQELGAAFRTGVFSYFPRLLAWPILAIQVMLLPEEKIRGFHSISLSAARFAEPDSTPQLLQLMMRLDLFVLWTTVILAIGLKVTGKISGDKAALAGFIMFLIGSLWPLISYLRA